MKIVYPFGKPFLLFWLFTINAWSLSGQRNVDSLIQVFHEAEAIDQQLMTLNKVVHYTAFTDTKVAEKYALIHDSIAYLQDNSLYHGQAKSLLGRIYFAKENYDKCAENFLAALKIAENRKDTAQVASMCNNLTAVFWTQRDTINSINFNKKTLQYYGYSNNDYKLGIGNLNLGTVYFDTEQYDSAMVYIQKSINHYELANRPAALSRPYYMMAKVSGLKGNFKTAVEYIQKAKLYIEEGKNPNQLADIYMWEGEMNTELANYKKAKSSFTKAEGLVEKHDLKNQRTSLDLHWASYYKSKGDYKIAFEKLEEHHRLREEAVNADTDLKINELNTKYETEKKEAEIARLNYEDQLKASHIGTQQKAIGGLVLGLVLLSLLLYRNFRQRKKIESQSEVIKKSLKEKDVLLREIHHRVKNNLQLVSSLLGLQSHHIKDPNALEALTSGKSRVKSMALIHQDLYNKENLTGVSVREYIEKLSSELMMTFNVDTNRIKLETDIPEILLDVDTLVPLGLIINELLTNALKYAFTDDRSGKIHIKIYEDSSGLKMDFSDNGIGLNMNKQTESSFGFRLIDTLLEQLEGEMQRKVDNGTHFNFTFSEYKIAA